MSDESAGVGPVVERGVRPLAERLRVLQVLLAGRHQDHHAAVHEALCSLEYESQSRGMFVARLKAMQESGDRWLTIEAVLALLDDCDMLAQRPNDRIQPA